MYRTARFLEDLAAATKWLWKHSAKVTDPQVRQARFAFEAMNHGATGTDFERIQAHITFIQAFVGRDFPEHGYLSQKLAQYLPAIDSKIDEYTRDLTEQPERFRFTDIAFNFESIEDDDIDIEAEGNHNHDFDPFEVYAWIHENHTPTVPGRRRTRFETEQRKYDTIIQFGAGTLIGWSIMAFLILTKPPQMQEIDQEQTHAKIDSAGMFLATMWSILILVLPLLRWHDRLAKKGINRFFDNIHSYLTDTNIVALHKKIPPSIVLFEVAMYWIQFPATLRLFDVTDAHHGTNWLALLSYAASVVAGQIVSRSVDTSVQAVIKCKQRVSAHLERQPHLPFNPQQLLITYHYPNNVGGSPNNLNTYTAPQLPQNPSAQQAAPASSESYTM